MSATAKKHRVMITGAGSPIGEHLVRTLLDDSRVGHILAVTGQPVANFPMAESERLTIAQVDLIRPRRVHQLLFDTAKACSIDTVIHTALHSSAIDEGDKVKVTMRFRGREMAHQNLGLDVMIRVQEEMKETAKVEQHPKTEGRQLVMVIAPR